MPSKKIVVFRSATLGDFILAMPAFHKLRYEFPSSEIVLLTTQSSQKLIRDSVARYSPTSPIPWVEFALPHLIDQVILLKGGLTFQYLCSLRRKTRKMDVEKIVLFLDPGAPWLGRFKKLALLIFLFGLRPMLGWRAKGSLNGNRRLLKDQGLLPHHVFGSMQFFHELHPNKVLSDSDVVFDLRIPEESQIWVDEVWREQDLGSCLVIAVALGSIQPHKRWPLEKYIELCQELLADEPSRRFLLVGTPADRLLAGHFLACVGKAGIDLVGKTSISQLAALLKRCSLLIGNDGGAMHLGDAVGCKVVSIVPGIEYPDSIEPWKNREYAVRHEVDCAPCYNFLECPLGHNKCMTELPLSTVLESCRKQLQP